MSEQAHLPKGQADDVVLEVENVTKRFPGVLANDNVSLRLRRGEILALLGENGAGKSTLMNVIYGLYRPDGGTIRLKGREVHFSSPREAIHSGSGMVHQHFQLVPVMTVAENVVLGEEADVARRGEPGTLWSMVLRWLPSLLVFALCMLIGLSLGKPVYIAAAAGIGVVLAVMVTVPASARLAWSITWRAGLVFVAIALAARIELIARVALTDLALQSDVETVITRRPQELDGYGVNVTVVERAPIPFKWSREWRDANNAGTGVMGVMNSAKAQLEVYRDNGVPGWMLDAIDEVPPVVYALTSLLLLLALGWHSITHWRGERTAPGPFRPADLAILAGLGVLYVAAMWLWLDDVERPMLAAISVLLAAGLGAILWREMRHRSAEQEFTLGKVSPLDGIIDAALSVLHQMTEIRNPRAAAEHVREISRQYGLEVDPDAVIEKLPVGMQQRVEIIKALYRKADILILDEPTAVLTPQESRELFKIMRELASMGVSIIFITHKLKEVFEVATNIVVMRGGQVVGTTTPAQATEPSLAAMMVGREVILQVEKGPAAPKEKVLEVRGLSAIDNRGAQALNDVSFDVRAGEVLGIAGVQGNGQTELVEVLTGLRTASSGSVKLLGSELQPDVQPEASIGAQVSALALDTLIVAVFTYLLGGLVFYFGDSSLGGAGTGTRLITWAIVLLVVDVLYFLGCWRAWGTTLGMSLSGLHIVDLADRKAPGLALVQRYVIWLALRLPAFLPLIAALRQARQHNPQRAWFDSRLGLRVIRLEHITPRRIKDMGTSHVPEDRQRHGLVKPYSVADNLVLNDFYESPYAQPPTAAELPFALLSYLVVAGTIIAGLLVLALEVWDRWLWNALLDLYHIPETLRAPDIISMSNAQRAANQYPLIVSVLALLVLVTVAGLLAHTLTLRLLGYGPVRDALYRVNRRLNHAVQRNGADDPGEGQGGLLRNSAAINDHALRLIDKFDIRTPGPHVEGGTLSGGNQQKLIVAREFSRRPRLLIAAQPTRGIDVGSIEFIHNQIIEQRDEGAAVLLVSAELDEIMALSDRIAVLYKGQIIDTLPAHEATREQLGLLMAGVHPADGR